MQKYTLVQLFPSLGIKHTTAQQVLTLIPTPTGATFEYVGEQVKEGTLTFADVPAAVAVALKAERLVELTALNGALVTKGLTDGEAAMLVPRFYAQPQALPTTSKVIKPKITRHRATEEV